jgi:two-component system, LytTR family, response regulator
MTIKAVILDDELHCSKGLQMQLAQVCPQVEIIQTFNAPLQALDFVAKNSFDILFLDVEMPTLNGFDFLKKIGVPAFDVIFTTAYDQFAIKAFKYSAFDYLLKPIEDEDLYNSVAKWEKEKNTPLRYQVLMEQMADPEQKKLVLPTAEGMELIEINDIVCIDSDGNYSRLFFSNNTSLLVSRTLKEFEDMLEIKGFMRVHHSHIINLKKLRKYLKADGDYVVMEDGKKISVSRAHKDQVLEYINHISI